MEKGVGGVSIGVEGALLGVLGSTTWYAISGSYERIVSHYGRACGDGRRVSRECGCHYY